MPLSASPVDAPQAQPPSARRLWQTLIGSLLAAGVILVAVVLPAEYGVDPTGIGHRLGLTPISRAAAQSVALTDILAGNEKVSQGKAPGVLKPLPLPNPTVHQSEPAAARTETIVVTLPPNGQTEVKAVLQPGKVMLYSWRADRGQIYVDFHAHDPAWKNKSDFVRYQEADGTPGGQGSLVAPFAGEHGWYWLNPTDHPVVVTLTVSGFYDRLVRYGVTVQ